MIATVTLNPSLDEWMQLRSLRVGMLNRAAGFARYPGGKGINVSRVVRELGGRTVAFALAGGEDGVILRELLNRLRIPHEFVTVAGLTRNNYKIRTERPRALTEINMAGPRMPASAVHALQQRLLRRRPAPQCVVLSGSLPPGVPASIYQGWITRFRRRGIPSVLDASGGALKLGLAARPWLVKPNRQEAQEVLGRPIRHRAEAVEAARGLLARGPQLVILSLGGAGAVLASGAGVWEARPPVVKADSAVGAGDSLVAGFLVGWSKTRDLAAAFRWAIASGTAAAMTPGTELCHRRDVVTLLRRVSIRRLS